MEYYSHHSFEKCRKQNTQDFEPLVLGGERLCVCVCVCVCVICVEETCITGDRIVTWQYCLKTDLNKHMESP